MALLSCAPVTEPGVGLASQPATTPARGQPVAGHRADRIVPYAPGIRINWTRSIVELDARVVMRQGPLELFACAPHTREHEAIVVVSARPRRIYEALGLIGLEPGAPVGYDESGPGWMAAHGARLRIDVVIHGDRTEQVCGIHEWMRRAAGGAPLERRDWVFAGSGHLPGGRFAADLEGTVICVVDFGSALIALPEPHTSDNAALWLEADPARIPPLGTTCVLRISSAERGRTLVHVGPDGELRIDGRVLTIRDLEHHLCSRRLGDPGAHALLVPEDDAAQGRALALKARLARHGLSAMIRAPAAMATTQPSARLPDGVSPVVVEPRLPHNDPP